MNLDNFGFDNDDWLAQARGAEAPLELGNVGEYELLEEIGRGGQGVVWKAQQPRTGRIIALKRMLAGSLASSTTRLRFEREVEAAASLAHPGIVTVFALEVVEGQPLLAMEWVDGVPCTEWIMGPLAQGSEQPVCKDHRLACELFLRIADAVAHAHSRGIVHRDLKPSNILVDAAGAPHVLDFGLAKRMHSGGGEDSANLTDTGQILGTPAYAAPEQLRALAAPVDQRADIYSLGVVLYEMLTSSRPYPKTKSIVELLAAVEHTEPKRPSRLNPLLTKEHDAIVLRAMAKDPEERYPNLVAFAADVRSLLEGQAVGAVVPSNLYYLRKLIKRNRLASLLIAALFLVVLGFGTHSALQAGKLRRSNKELESTVKRLTESSIDLDAALNVVANPPNWVQVQADETLKDFLPPCLVEPEASTNFERLSKDFDQDFWGEQP